MTEDRDKWVRLYFCSWDHRFKFQRVQGPRKKLGKQVRGEYTQLDTCAWCMEPIKPGPMVSAPLTIPAHWVASRKLREGACVERDAA